MIQEQVLWLDVAMHDVQLVQELDATDDLMELSECLELLDFCQRFIKYVSMSLL